MFHVVDQEKATPELLTYDLTRLLDMHVRHEGQQEPKWLSDRYRLKTVHHKNKKNITNGFLF